MKFREAAAAAYPLPRSADAERTLVHAYIRSLYHYDIKKKIIEHHPANVDAAMNRAEQIDSDRDQCRRLIGDRKEEPMEVVAYNTTAQTDNRKTLQEIKKQLDNLTTDVGKMKTQQWQKGERRQEKKRWTDDGRPICFFCQKPGHMMRECRKKKGAQKGPAPPNFSMQGNG